MKILYFGTVCNSDTYNQISACSRTKPTAAAFVFESALLQGFRQHKADLEVFSFPVVPAFPKSPFLFIKGLTTELDCGYASRQIPAVNITGLKQLTQRLTSRRMLKRWLKENFHCQKAVMIYSIYQPVAKSIVTLCKKTGTPCFAIVPDLPRDMYANIKISPVKKFFSRFYTKAAEKIQGKFDGYIYFTKHMKDIINPSAPYVVTEGIASEFDISGNKKSQTPSVMYAGALNEKMGIKILLDAFAQIPDKDINLWLFGTGDCEIAVKEVAKKDSRIKYFGHQSRKTILEYEKQAHLLVNLRNPGEEYTKFSFPSKTIEYMLSGTPLLTTKLPGIPDEYFDCCYIAHDISAGSLGRTITEILSKPAGELEAFGMKARKFILENKNGSVQTEKILQFIYENVKRSAYYEHKT